MTRLSLVVGLGLVPLAAQSMPSPGMGPRQTRMVDRMAEYLKLTDAQKSQIQAIQAKHADEIKAKVQAAVEAHKSFKEALKNPDTAATQLKPLYQAQADRDFDLLLDRRAMQNEIRAVLTPEQRAEMDKLQSFHRGMMKGRGMGGPGMGY